MDFAVASKKGSFPPPETTLYRKTKPARVPANASDADFDNLQIGRIRLLLLITERLSVPPNFNCKSVKKVIPQTLCHFARMLATARENEHKRLARKKLRIRDGLRRDMHR